MLDIATLRVALALLTGTLVMLFYGVTYRTTRSAFAAWWCLCLGMLTIGSAALLSYDTPHQAWAIPVSYGFNTAGAGCVWAGGRSLGHRRVPWKWLVLLAVAVVGLASLDDPAGNDWPAGGVYLATVWVLLAMATLELVRVALAVRAYDATDQRGYQWSLGSIAAVCAFAGLFYFGQWASLVLAGQDHPAFTTVFGDETTAMMLIVLLATVAFNMTTLSDEQQKQALREIASRDGLTGLLNRPAFLRLAEEALARGAGVAGQVVMADLDHFKRVNDEHGHAAGDRAITTFADACRASVRSGDLAARYGGEEFVLLLPGAGPARAIEVVRSVSAHMAELARTDPALPTVSYGIAVAGLPLEDAIERADQALYRAKETGRDRAVQYADLA